MGKNIDFPLLRQYFLHRIFGAVEHETEIRLQEIASPLNGEIISMKRSLRKRFFFAAGPCHLFYSNPNNARYS